MASEKDILLPDIGDFEGVEIIDIAVSEGDRVEAEDTLMTLETDKATVDVPSPHAGTIKRLKVKAGDKVSEGDLLGSIDTDDDDAEASEAASSKDDKASESDEDNKPSPQKSSNASEGKGKSARQEIRVPDVGDFKDVEIIEVLVSEGDTLEAEQGLFTLETDKATMDVPSPVAGKLLELKVKAGDTVNEGDVVAVVESADSADSDDQAEQKQADREAKKDASDEQAPADKTESKSDRADDEWRGHERIDADTGKPLFAKDERTPPVAPNSGELADKQLPYASPAVRQFARELGVNLHHVVGTGRKGRIQKDDVQAYVKQRLKGAGSAAQASGEGAGLPGLNIAPPPKVDFSKFGEVETKPLSRIRKLSGANLARNWISIPHVTQFEKADITEMEAFRKANKAAAEAEGAKLTPLVFLIKAVVAALQKYPQFNASLDESGENLVLKKYFHVGVAVDTPNGLVVPVLRDCDQKGLLALSKELAEISGRARDGKLKPDEMKGGCFSISSLGGIGGTSFTPIVNAPEVAILGVSRSEMEPRWNGESFEPRLMLPLSLSYDHRVIDGADAARFALYLAERLGDIRRLLL